VYCAAAAALPLSRCPSRSTLKATPSVPQTGVWCVFPWWICSLTRPAHSANLLPCRLIRMPHGA
jgi:hypothetical protein